jgi:hypothetical protein
VAEEPEGAPSHWLFTETSRETDGIWFELLRYVNSADDRWIQELTKDQLNFNEAVALLCSFGLVDPDKAFKQQFGPGG